MITTVGTITNRLPAFAAAVQPMPEPARVEAAAPEALKVAEPSDLSVVAMNSVAPASLEVPIDQILATAVYGNTPIGTLSQLRSQNPEDFLSLVTKVLHNSGIRPPAPKSYVSQRASLMANAVTTTQAPLGAGLDVAA